MLSQRILVAAFACGVASLVSPLAMGANAQPEGVVSGVVRTKATQPRPLRITTDQRVCGTELPDESIVVDASGNLANAVVTLVGVKAAAGASTDAAIVNQKCAFVPRVQIARPGASVKVSSADAVLHNTNLLAESGTSVFNIGLPVPGLTITRRLTGAGHLRVVCNVHPWMRGSVVATEEMAAVTGADGAFRLSGVPHGTYELRVWHEVLAGGSQKVTVAAGKPAQVTIDLQAKK